MVLALASMIAVSSCGRNSVSFDNEDVTSVVDTLSQESQLGFCPDSLSVVEGKVKNGQFFSTLLTSLGLSAGEAYDLTQACGDIFDVRALRVGNAYKAYYGESLQYLVYDRDRTSQIIFQCQPPYEIEIKEKPVSVECKYADVTINNSLWVDMSDAGVSPHLILSLSDIYAWTVDFFGIQQGDSFTVIYDEKFVDTLSVGIGRVWGAKFNHLGKDIYAIPFPQDGKVQYWEADGGSLRKQLLKAPLKFTRISSKFSYSRYHPVLKKYRPHTGVDYAAPAGTPVRAVADGTVTLKGYKGAGGHTVYIKHPGKLQSGYLHLKGYAKGIAVGKRVSQGQVIGYVGSTGRSTGPHLDFRLWKNGQPINPLKVPQQPSEPIKEANREKFEWVKARVIAELEGEVPDSMKITVIDSVVIK